MKTILRMVAIALSIFATTYVEVGYAAEPYGFLVNDYVKTTDNLNVRSAAGTGASLVGTIAKGGVGKVLSGPTLKNNYYWWKVDFPIQNVTGWCVQDYLTLYNARTEENWYGTRVSVKGTGSSGLRIRSGAGLSYSVVATLPEGTVFTVVGGPTQKDAYVWWKLFALTTSQTGWGVQQYLAPYTPPPDTTRPTITLLGSSTVTLAYGASYTDAGATASDNVDGAITSRIVTTGLPIATSTPGTYNVRYNVKDSAGNAATEVVRRVTVQAQTPPPPPPTTTITIFDDAIAAGWVNSSWSTTVFLTNSFVYSGTHGLGVAFTAPWAGLYLKRSMHTAGYQTLRFVIQGPTSGGLEPLVALLDGTGSVLKWLPITNYVTGNRLAANTWYSVVIPLTDLLASNKDILGISVTSEVANTGLYLDNITLSTVAGTTYSPPTTPPPAPSVSATLFADSIGSGWLDWSWATTNPDAPLHYEGSEGFTATFTAPWQGVYFDTEGFSTVGYNALTFAIHGGSAGAQKLFVTLNDESGNALNNPGLDPASYIVGGILTPYAWHQVRIPLTDLKGLNRTITGVTIQSETATAITLDGVRFISTTATDTGVCND